MRSQQQRSEFLQSQGLSHDPFESGVAEREVFPNTGAPRFFTYFVSCDVLATGQGILVSAPPEREHAVIIGAPGTGKTALRFAWEATSRALKSRTLFVTYTLHDELVLSGDRDHVQPLGESIATDLFIHLAEQYHPVLMAPDASRIAALRSLFEGYPYLASIIRTLLASSTGQAHLDANVFWRDLRRPAVRTAPIHPALLDLLARSAPAEGVTHADTWSMHTALNTALAWGFEHVRVCIDLDESLSHQPGRYAAWIRRLSPLVEQFKGAPLSFHLLVTPAVRDAIQPLVEALQESAPLNEMRVQWSAQQLRSMLARRLKASGTRWNGLYRLADERLAPDLDRLIVAAADRSPRRMLTLIRQLLDTHLQSSDASRPIGVGVWQSLQRT